MPTVKLSSQKLRLGSVGSSGLSAPRASVNAGAALSRGVQVNTNAANVKFTPAPVPGIQPDPILNAAIKAGGSVAAAKVAYDRRLMLEAERVQEEREQVLATEAILSHRERLREGYYGTAGVDGKVSGGYGNTEGIDSQDGFQAYMSGVDKDFKNSLSGLDPAVREKALLRMHSSREQYLGLASRHNSAQMDVTKEQVKYVAQQSILKDVEKNGVDALLNGGAKTYLDQFNTQQEKDIAYATLAQQALYSEYSTVLNAGPLQDPIKAYRATEEAAKKILPALDETSEGKIEHWMSGLRAQAERLSKSTETKNKKAIFDKFVSDTPQAIAFAASNADAKNVKRLTDQVRAFAPPGKGDTAVVGVLKGSLDLALRNPSLTTVEQRMAEVNTIVDGMGLESQEQDIRWQVTAYAKGELKNKVYKAQELTDSLTLLEVIENPGKYPVGEYPAGMLQDGKDNINNYRALKVKERHEGVDVNAKNVGDNHFRAKVVMGKLSSTDLTKAAKLVGLGQMTDTAYGKLKQALEKQQTAGYTGPAFRQETDFKAIIKVINNTARTQGLIYEGDLKKLTSTGTRDTRKRKKSIEYMAQNTILQEQALVSLDNAARQAAMDKKPFDAQEWWKKWVADAINSGNVISRNWFLRGFDAVSDWGAGIAEDVMNFGSGGKTGMD